MRLRGVLLAILLIATAAPARATVTTTTRTVTYTGSGGTEFTVTFPFILAGDLKVQKRTVATGATVTLTQNVNYTVCLPNTTCGTSGKVTVTPAVSNAYQIIISRVVPYTQTTSLTTSGAFNAKSVETMADKLTMELQQLIAGVAVDSDITAAIAAHSAAADPHTGYHLLAGRAGGQYATGGTAASDNLTLRSTAHATKGKIKLGAAGNSAYDETTDYLGIGTAAPAYRLDVPDWVQFGDTTKLVLGSQTIYSPSDDTAAAFFVGASTAAAVTGASSTYYGASHSTKPSWIDFKGANFRWLNMANAVKLTFTPSTGLILAANQTLVLSDDVNSWVQTPMIYGGTTAAHSLQIFTTTNATKGKVLIGSSGTELVVDDAQNYVGVGTATPTVELDVSGRISGRRTLEFQSSTYTVGTLANDCGGVIASAPAGAADATITLPLLSASTQGCMVTVIHIGASATGRVRLSPNAADKIVGTCVGVTFGGVADRDAWNTEASSVKGDYLTVVAINSANPAWYVIGCVGVWASEP